MVRDTTLEERFETVLYHFGVSDSGVVASQLHDEYLDWVENAFSIRALEILDGTEDAE